MVGFVPAVKSGLSKYVVWQGRATRSEYWFFVLFVYLCVLVPAVLLGVFKASESVSVTVLLIIYAPLFLPTLSVLIRRLHDTGRNGAWYWISLVPYVGGIILLVFMCLRSDPGPNAYGPPSDVGRPENGLAGDWTTSP